MTALALSKLSDIVDNALELFQASRLRFFEHFLLDLVLLVYLAPATTYRSGYRFYFKARHPLLLFARFGTARRRSKRLG